MFAIASWALLVPHAVSADATVTRQPQDVKTVVEWLPANVTASLVLVLLMVESGQLADVSLGADVLRSCVRMQRLMGIAWVPA